jgi:2,3-bisphosphoglycerate-independent phosphoglycerate mutase
MRTRPLVLVIRDGWGENPNREHEAFDAVRLARTPVDDALRQDWPWALIRTSGEDVGLPEGTMGNSEVGHQNIGAGRVVDQESVAITKACRRGLRGNAVLTGAIERARGAGTSVHLLGIASDAGVHGLLEHMYAVAGLCAQLGQFRVHVHLFTDGRDTGPRSGLGYVEEAEARLSEAGAGRIASVMGRYWAMDRDCRWERVQRAYDALTGRGASRRAATAAKAVRSYYDAPEAENLAGDEYVPPTVIAQKEGEARESRISDGDTVIFCNYRGDRPREIVSAFVLPDEAWAKVKASPETGRAGFDRGRRLELEFVTMAGYSEGLAPYVKVAFPRPAKMTDIAGSYLSRLGVAQFRCAETEKYPHVTYFFNDYRDEPFEGERRRIVQSPRVATYDLEPEMSADEVCEAVLERMSAMDAEAFMVVNFANADMVGHTGSLPAAIAACEAVDRCVGRLVEAGLGRGASLIVTADHGNAEQMWDPDAGGPHTAHTTYDVPLFVVGERFKGARLRGDRDAAGWFDAGARQRRGRLADIVPTALEMMGLAQPEAMSGESLLAH